MKSDFFIFIPEWLTRVAMADNRESRVCRTKAASRGGRHLCLPWSRASSPAEADTMREKFGLTGQLGVLRALVPCGMMPHFT